MFQTYRKRYPLITRIVTYTFLFAILVSVLMLALQIYFYFTLEKQRIDKYLTKLEETQIDTLVNNVWSLDQGAIEIQINSILGDPDIVYIWLQYEPDSENIQEFGTSPDPADSVFTKEYDLIRERPDGGQVLIGSVGFVAATNISKRFVLESSGRLLASLITIVVVCLFILFLFITFYSRHINSIVNYTEELDIGRLDQQLVLNRSKKDQTSVDEIDRIVGALNSMRIRVNDGVQAQYSVEKELTREKLFSDAIINSMPGIFFVLDDCLKVVRMNRAFIDFLGISDSLIMQYDLFASIPGERKEQIEEMFYSLFVNKELIVEEINLIGAASSRKVPFLLTVQLLEIEDAKYLIGVGSDLTDRKRMETQLRQSQKMEALGTLAGGISHDFNNILSAIVGYTSLAKLEYQGDGKLKKYLDTIEDASDRAKVLVQQILDFSRKTEAVREPVKVADIVTEVMALLKSSLPSTIQIKQNIDSNLLSIVDPTDIYQVIMNLCTNSFHAMQDEGGVLSVSLSECVVVEDNSFPEIDIVDGRYLTLEISDTGQGMNAETRSKIFEPYFTTKETGVGTGLGLAVVHGIVTSYKGYIYVYSVPQEGTSFTIYLPAVTDTVVFPNNQKEFSSPDMVQGQNERVLVVDDEKFILEFYEDLLLRYGYRVTSFVSSVEGLVFFKENSLEYDLVIVDQIMREMKGDKLAEGMWEVCPDIPVILCSGFSGALGRQEFLTKGFAAYIQKPVNGAVLLQTIRDILATKGQRT